MRILVIEDEPRMMELLRQGLQENGCAVMTASDGTTGLEITAACEFDVIVLDIGLPDIDGYQVVRTLQQRNHTARVLMLTARDSEDDIIRGLNLGADDYLTKPFSFAELMARLQAVSRVPREAERNRIEAGDLVVDLAKRSILRSNKSIDLSRSEFTLLLSLLRHAGRCVSRQQLTESIWGSGSDVGQGALDVLVNALRSKIDSPFSHKLVRTVRGEGYLLDCLSLDTNSPSRSISL
jgi:DNA-binding response OmpR family regulator